MNLVKDPPHTWRLPSVGFHPMSALWTAMVKGFAGTRQSIPIELLCKSYYVVRPSVATMTIASSSWGGGLICKVGAEVTCQADPRLEGSRAVWARDGGSCRGPGYLSLPARAARLHKSCWLQISCRPRSPPPTYVLCFSVPRVMVDGKCLEGGL